MPPLSPDSVRPEDEQRVHDRLDAKMRSMPKDPDNFLRKILADVRTLYDLLRDSSFKIDWAAKAQIIFCLLYFISPADMVPDFIPGLGLVDDALVIGWTMKVLRDLIEGYRAYIGRGRHASS